MGLGRAIMTTFSARSRRLQSVAGRSAGSGYRPASVISSSVRGLDEREHSVP